MISERHWLIYNTLRLEHSFGQTDKAVTPDLPLPVLLLEETSLPVTGYSIPLSWLQSLPSSIPHVWSAKAAAPILYLLLCGVDAMLYDVAVRCSSTVQARASHQGCSWAF